MRPSDGPRRLAQVLAGPGGPRHAGRSAAAALAALLSMSACAPGGQAAPATPTISVVPCGTAAGCPPPPTPAPQPPSSKDCGTVTAPAGSPVTGSVTECISSPDYFSVVDPASGATAHLVKFSLTIHNNSSGSMTDEGSSV